MNAEKKKIYAPKGKENKVFTRIGSGLWTADLYGNPVILERAKHDHWKCIDENTSHIIGEGSTRNEAMKEAFYNVAESKGYDAREAVRLEWILESDIYRSYDGHKPRKSFKKDDKEKPKEYQKVTPINRVSKDEAEQMRLNDIFKQYTVAFNKILGGWFFYKKNKETGDIETGVQGPFASESQMFEAILQCEAERIAKK